MLIFTQEEDIAAFHRRFLPTTTISAEFGLHRNVLRKRLAAARVSRFGPKWNGFRCGLSARGCGSRVALTQPCLIKQASRIITRHHYSGCARLARSNKAADMFRNQPILQTLTVRSLRPDARSETTRLRLRQVGLATRKHKAHAYRSYPHQFLTSRRNRGKTPTFVEKSVFRCRTSFTRLTELVIPGRLERPTS